MSKGKKILLGVLIGIVNFVMVISVTLAAVFRVELNVIEKIEKIDDYGFFSMNYTEDYELDDLLSVGVSTDQQLIDYIVKKLFKGIPIHIDISDYACSTFMQKPQKDTTFSEEILIGDIRLQCWYGQHLKAVIRVFP